MNPIEAQQICQSAEQALRHGSFSLHQFPGLLKRVIEGRLWEQRQVAGRGVVALTSLRELITSKPLLGWGEDPEKIEAVIREDAEVLTLWRDAMKEQGRRNDLGDNITQVKRQPRGTSRAYTLDKLKRQRPDLYEQVVEKQLSAHAAAIEAGFVKTKTILQQLEHWWGKASAKDRQTFLRTVQGGHR